MPKVKKNPYKVFEKIATRVGTVILWLLIAFIVFVPPAVGWMEGGFLGALTMFGFMVALTVAIVGFLAGLIWLGIWWDKGKSKWENKYG